MLPTSVMQEDTATRLELVRAHMNAQKESMGMFKVKLQKLVHAQTFALQGKRGTRQEKPLNQKRAQIVKKENTKISRVKPNLAKYALTVNTMTKLR